MPEYPEEKLPTLITDKDEDILDIVTSGAVNAHEIKGIFVHGRDALTNQSRYLPVSQNTAPNADKGATIIPVTPMTGIKEEGVMAHSHEVGFITSYGANAIAATTGWIIIDLSDIVNWHHNNTARVDIEWIDLHLMADNAAEGVFEIGVVIRVDATNGDVLWLHRAFMDKSAEHHKDFNNYFPAHARMSASLIAAGGTSKSTDDVTFQTDVDLASLAGNIPPAVGDIVAKYTHTAGNLLNWNLIVGYHTH